ncbi:hypothetical protein scyTo_0021608, partial [Scyliorhinus torazame]|nr:hypothetical protein [Scyliorhinus torazame]
MVVCLQADKMVRLKWPLFQTLRGVFAVYKPPGIHWKRLRDTVETKLLKVKGPKFVGLKVGAGHRLDLRSSGVLVLGVGNGNQQLVHLHDRHLTKARPDHITLERLERIIAVIQGIHQRALLTYSGIDLKSQEAYELASRGLLRPMHKSPPIITAIRCVHFSPPNFTLGQHK